MKTIEGTRLPAAERGVSEDQSLKAQRFIHQ